MKKIFLLSLILLSVIAVGCKKKELSTGSKLPVDNPSFAIKEKIILGLDDSFPPMGFRDEENKIVGFDIDMAREVAKRLNVDLMLQPIDWASKELELNNGNISMIWNGLSVDPARQEAMLLSKPYLKNKMVIIVQHGSIIKFKAGLKGKQIGVQAGSTAVKSVNSDPIGKSLEKLIEFENNVLALSDLAIGRIDAVVMDEVVARYLIMKDNNTKYSILEDNFGNEVYAIGFKKDNAQLRDKIQGAIDSMNQDGTSAVISRKWFGDDIVLK